MQDVFHREGQVCTWMGGVQQDGEVKAARWCGGSAVTDIYSGRNRVIRYLQVISGTQKMVNLLAKSIQTWVY